MAISAPVLLTTQSSASFESTVTTASITPAAGSLLLVAAGVGTGGVSSTTLSITDTLTDTGVWTQYSVIKNDADTFVTAIFWAIAGSTPGSGTISVMASENMARWCIAVHEVTGFNGSSPVLQSATDANANTTLAVEFTGAPAASSLVFGALSSRADASISPGALFTETTDFSSGGAGNNQLQTQYRLNDVDPIVDWADLNTLNNTAVAVEIGTSIGKIKAYNGASFDAKPVKVWNGSTWVQKPVKRWDGTSWVVTPY